MAVNTLPTGGTTGHGKYAFGSFAGRDMLIWLKGLALDPCNMQSSHHRLRSQMLKVRRLLNTSDTKSPQRKRKFKQYMNDGKFVAAFGLISIEKSDNQNAKKPRIGQSSSLSCSPHSNEKRGSLQRKQGNVTFSALNDTSDCKICMQDFSLLSDSDEPINGTNPVKKENLKSHDDSIETLHSLSLENEDRELNQPMKFILSRGNHLIPRPVIPIGPRFQAEVPNWEGPTHKRHCNSDDDLRWLGTQIWPMPDITKSNTKGIGKGKPYSCSCDFPGSVDCVKQHVSEARLLLQSEIGTTFSSWKFDEMGEDVSKSWTLEDQMKFESLVKLNPLSNDTNFWRLAMEHFPSKSMKSMVNYYYNVYIPRRMSLETRSSFGVVDSDNDQNEDYQNEDECLTTGMRIVPICKFLHPRITIKDNKPHISTSKL